MPVATSPKPSSKPHRTGYRLLPVLLLVFAGLVAGHAVLWRWMGNQLEDGFAAWEQTRRAGGWVVEHGTPVRGGWPFAATLTVPRFHLAGGGQTVPGGMDWTAESLVLRVAPPRLDRLTVEAAGRHRLRLGELELPFAADRLVATLPLEEGVLPSEAELAADHLRIGTPAGGLELRRLDLGLQTRLTATEGEPAASLGLQATGVALPPNLLPPGLLPSALNQPAAGGAGSGLGNTVEELSADLALTGPVPSGRDPAARAATWRDNGGTLELRGLRLRWGPLGAAVSATCALDADLQPMGAGTLRLTGYDETLDALAGAGVLAPRAAAGARTMAMLMARPGAAGEAPVLELPMALENRWLTLSRLRVARLPAWTWAWTWPGADPARSPAAGP